MSKESARWLRLREQAANLGLGCRGSIAVSASTTDGLQRPLHPLIDAMPRGRPATTDGRAPGTGLNWNER